MEKEVINMKEEGLLKAWEILESNWQHRDKIMWRVIFTFFYAIIVCNALQFLGDKYNFGDIVAIFPILAFLCTYCFFYVANAYAVRLTAVGNSINKIRAQLDCKPEDLKDNLLEKAKTAKVIALMMFFVLLIVDSVSLYLFIKTLDVLLIVLIYAFIALLTVNLILLACKRCTSKKTTNQD